MLNPSLKDSKISLRPTIMEEPNLQFVKPY